MGARVRERAVLGVSLAAATAFVAGFFTFKSSCPFVAVEPNSDYVRKAMFWERMDLGVKCGLCPFNCYIPEGAKGKCRVRMNRNGTLFTQVYGQPVSLALDPIEKKPVFHMLPGSAIVSVSTVGCPLRCSFCQNWSLSQIYPEQAERAILLGPADLVQKTIDGRVPSIAYTYGEPAIFYEYMYDTARLAKERGLRNVMVTSGFINPEPLKKLAPYLDVVKVDLKGISEEFYLTDVGGFRDAVLGTLKLLKKLDVLVEVVNLVVPTRNDSDSDLDQLTKWVRDNLGQDTPIFFSRFHPDYRMRNLPPTPIETLEKARGIAKRNGLNFVYVGNVAGHEGESTYCPDDGTVLIRRRGYLIDYVRLKDGRCPRCGREIPGIWR